MAASRTYSPLVLTLVALLGTAVFALSAPSAQAAKLRAVKGGFQQPVHVSFASGDTRIWVVERAGRIRVLRGGTATTFLDIRSQVRDRNGEQGLLSVAFHPNYRNNDRFYVMYNNDQGDLRVAEHFGRGRANQSSGRVLMTINKPFANHNGGLLQFGPDGLLYIGTGDGGGGGDPRANAQNRRSLLGKILRVDVDSARPYGIPPSNPFAGSDTFRREIFAYGLRNPWRYSFDARDKTMWIGDVGEGKWEEVNRLTGPTPGHNFGWDVWEATMRFEQKPLSGGTHHRPFYKYDHDTGCSITGGYVYRSSRIPGLRGTYLFADYCRNWIRGFRVVNGRRGTVRTFPGVAGISSFGQANNRDIFLTSLSGTLYKIVPS